MSTFDKHLLVGYAERLVRILTRDLSRLGDSGVPLPAAAQLALNVSEYDPRRERLHGIGNEGDSDPVAASVKLQDWDVLDKWAERPVGERGPLLLLGPFGSGKSVMLASFSLRLAQRLHLDAQTGRMDRILVPLPVRLRAWIGFITRHPDASFQRFLHESQFALGENAAGALDTATLERLLAEQKLAPLFDGFDELPGDHESTCVFSRRTILRSIQDICNDFYVLTSRPGYEAELAIDDQSHYHIRALALPDIQEFIDRRFANDDRRRRTARDVLRSASALRPDILRRPLLLAAWAQCLPRDGSLPPLGVRAIMSELAVSCFDKKREATRLSMADAEGTLHALGKLLTAFADEGFDSCLALDSLRTDFEEDFSGEGLTLEEAIAVAVGTGFLIPIGKRSWYAVKTPVVEFLIARRLANEATKEGEPRELVRRFQNWVFRPELHVVLDYVFTSLWEGTLAQRQWAEQLLQWMSAIDWRTCDVVYPLPLLSVRWHSLNDQLDGGAEEKANAVALEAGRAIGKIPSRDLVKHLFVGWSPKASLVCQMIYGFIEKMGDELTAKECAEVSRFTRGVVEHEAAAAIDMLLPLARRSKGDIARDAWLQAIIPLADKLSEEEGIERANQWLTNYRKETDSILWENAIAAAASCVSPEKARATAESWLDQWKDADPGQQSALERAIGKAAGRVPAPEASRVTERWIERATEANDAWRQAVFVVAANVPEAEVEAQIAVWQERHQEAEAAKRLLWSTALAAVRTHIGQQAAPAHFKHLYHIFRETNDYPLTIVLNSVGGRMTPTNASETVDFLIKETDVDGSFGEQFRGFIIAGAIAVVPPEELPGIIEKLCSQYPLISPNGKSSWFYAIDAAVRFSQKMAAALIGEWIDRAGNEREHDAWATAIKSASPRLEMHDADELLRKAMKIHDRAPVAEQEKWKTVMVQFVPRLPRSSALKFFEWLIQRGRITAAITLARTRTDLAIAWDPNHAARTVVRLDGESDPHFDVTLRKGVLLDDSAASARIRQLLASPPEEPKTLTIYSNAIQRERSVGQFIFRRGPANTWEFAFDSSVRVVGGDFKGFEYIARLLEQPNRWMAPSELALQAADRPRSSRQGDARDDLLDAQAIGELRQRRKELQQHLLERDDPRYEEELRAIDEQLRKAVRPGRKNAKLGASELKRASQRVEKAILRALSHLHQSGLGELATHLAECARPDDYGFVYRQSNPPAWTVNWLPPES